MSFIEQVQRRIYSKTSMFATWLPTDQVAVGDYGLVRRGRFIREGQLRQRGIPFNEAKFAGTPNKLAFSDRAKFSSRNALGGVANALNAQASLDISLAGEGAFVYQLEDIVARRVADKQAFFTAVFRAILARKLKWQDDFVLVDEVRAAGSATIIVLENDAGKLVLKGKIPANAGPSVPLASLKGQISIDVESGSVFQVVGADSTTPLYSARRLTFDPPGGPDSPRGQTISALVEWVKEKTGVGMPRPVAVNEVDYIGAEEKDTLRLSLAGRTFSISAEAVPLEMLIANDAIKMEAEEPARFAVEEQAKYVPSERSAGA